MSSRTEYVDMVMLLVGQNRIDSKEYRKSKIYIYILLSAYNNIAVIYATFAYTCFIIQNCFIVGEKYICYIWPYRTKD